MKKHIPNFLTSCNLLCGCIGIVSAFNGNLVASSIMIGIAALFDFSDGMAARLLKAYSSIGKELDSLADVVSFGVLPGIIMFLSIYQNIQCDSMGTLTSFFISPIPFFAFLITVFSALRLAIFNVDESQTTTFKGLPTPACAIFVASIPLIESFHPKLFGKFELLFVISLFKNPFFLIFCTILLAYLLVSPIRLFSLKIKSLSFAKNTTVFTFLIASFALFFIFSAVSIPIIIFLYIGMSLATQKQK